MAEVVAITQGHVSQILSGDRELSNERIRRLAERFKLDPAALL